MLFPEALQNVIIEVRLDGVENETRLVPWTSMETVGEGESMIEKIKNRTVGIAALFSFEEHLGLNKKVHRTNSKPKTVLRMN